MTNVTQGTLDYDNFGSAAVGQISTSKSSVDQMLSTRAIAQRRSQTYFRPEELLSIPKSQNYNNYVVTEAEESEESPAIYAPSPLRAPVMHKLQPRT